jgi:exonuclease III
LCQIVFWNVNRKDLTVQIRELMTATGADVLVLNECCVPISDTLAVLKSGVDQHFYVPYSISEKRFHCFCKTAELDLSELHNGFRSSFRKLNYGTSSAVLGLVHGVDMRNYDPPARQAAAQVLSEDIRFVNTQHRQKQLILIGDFNMNPYDPGMNLATGLNAMMTKACVASGHRTFLGKEYDFFYNPMWSLFGDGSHGPAGTTYDTSNQGPYGWSMLDQVLIHYSLVKDFVGVQIMTLAGETSLIDARGRPDSRSASDHLPILLKLAEISHE